MSNRAKALLLLLGDVLIILLTLTIVLWLRHPDRLNFEFIKDHLVLFSGVFPFWLLMIFIEGLYSIQSFQLQNTSIVGSLLRASFITMTITVVVTYFLPPDLIDVTPKSVLLLTAIIGLPYVYMWRLFFFNFFSASIRRRKTVVLGAPKMVDFVTSEINNRPFLGFNIIQTSLPIPNDAEVVVIERDTFGPEVYGELFQKLEKGVEIIDLAGFSEMISGKIPLDAINESWFIEYCAYQRSRSQEILKSLIDKAVALTLLLILILPFTLILLPVLLILHGRPVFFKQTRTGLYNKPFTLYKLRTMVIDAEKNGAQWAKPGDARITPLGKILRKTRLDELPQLLNIIKGEMSLVGPRPERPEIIESKLAPNIPFYNLRHLVKPGVTGWAQVVFRYGFSQEDSKEKLQYDLFYVKNKSLWLDVIVILRTIKTVITGAGQ
jgi:exopolysaccharide biosynthesis polyprenyl glycosylphosphotransferase